MKVRVDQSKCQGHTHCSFTAPELFALREDDGCSYAIHEDVPRGLEDLAEDAARGCPEGAILVFTAPEA